MNNMWGIHNDALGAELVEKGFASIGCEEILDLRTVSDDSAQLKDLVRQTYLPSIKPGAVPAWAWFGVEMQQGDLAVGGNADG